MGISVIDWFKRKNCRYDIQKLRLSFERYQLWIIPPFLASFSLPAMLALEFIILTTSSTSKISYSLAYAGKKSETSQKGITLRSKKTDYYALMRIGFFFTNKGKIDVVYFIHICYSNFSHAICEIHKCSPLYICTNITYVDKR